MSHIIVIGGTSGVGLALAQHHLQQDWQVTVIGSNQQKIDGLPSNLTDNPNFSVICCDINDNAARDNLLANLSQTPFNRLIYSAGKYYSDRKQSLNQHDNEIMLSVNLQAFQAIFAWASEQLKANDYQEKHLIAISSIAGLLDFDTASLYAKCKRAMIATCDAYRAGLSPFNIKVTCIASGYIDTAQLRAVNNNDISRKTHVLTEQQAVQEICNAIENNLALHIFPKPIKRTMSILSALPRPLLNQVMSIQNYLQNKQPSK